MKSFRFQALAGYALASGGAFLGLLIAAAPLAAVIVLAVAVVVGLAFVWLAAGSVAGSARIVAGAAREIAEGQFTVRLEDRPDGEMAVVFDAFNRMAARLESLVEAASQERNRLMAAINSSVDAVVAVDADSNVTFANAAVAGVLGRAPEEITGKPFVWTVADAGVIEGLRASREKRERSSHVIERPGRQYLRAIVTPIVGGGAWASLVVFHDLTDVRRVEEVRRDFVANVSHELRTPLAAIKSVIETLDAGALDDPVVAKDFLARADAETDRLVQMVEELLELSRMESGEEKLSREPVDAAAVVTEAAERLRPQAERKALRLTVEVDRLPPVEADRVSIERAVVNLVQNAIKFTPEGGSVSVRTWAEAGGATIEVADTGEGIEPRDLPRVFERFYKADRARQAGGTGLGLALVKHTAEAHGGRVDVESVLGSGSTFRIWLPCPAAPREPVEAEASPAMGDADRVDRGGPGSSYR